MNARYTNHSPFVSEEGHLYLRRDLEVERWGKVHYYPQHAIVREFFRVDAGEQPHRFDRLIWIGHEEGGKMRPLIHDFSAPGNRHWYDVNEPAE